MARTETSRTDTPRTATPRTRKLALAASALGGLILTSALATPGAQAQINVYIGTPPPPVRYQSRPALPAPGYSWVDGFWQPLNRGYQWHPGFWQQPPYAGAYYVHPHYDHYQQGWRLHEGYWSHEDHDDHHWDKEDHGDHHDNGNHYGERKHGKHGGEDGGGHDD